MSTWSCPHQTVDYYCQRVKRNCVPGMKGCVLRGKVYFAKNEESDLKLSLNPGNEEKLVKRDEKGRLSI